METSTKLNADIASGDIPEDVRIITDSPEQSEVFAEFGIPSLLQQDLPEGAFEQAQAATRQLPTSSTTRLSRFSGISSVTQLDDLATANAYRQIIENGTSDIIMDDSGFPFGPVYQQSHTARAQQDALDAGISVFESARNRGRDAVEVDFTSDVGDFVDFDPNTDGVQGRPVTYSAGETVLAALHWNDPFPSTLPPLGPNATSSEQGQSSEPTRETAEVTADFEFLFVAEDASLEPGATEPGSVILTSGIVPTHGSDRIQLDRQDGTDTVRPTLVLIAWKQSV